jgi:hypothetical protein
MVKALSVFSDNAFSDCLSPPAPRTVRFPPCDELALFVDLGVDRRFYLRKFCSPPLRKFLHAHHAAGAAFCVTGDNVLDIVSRP